jgi:two-component system cell cycle sensor histidine kinase/response regulator CckA
MPSAEPGQGDRTRVILVVDDEEDVRNLVGEILRQAGFDVLLATHGQEALKAVERSSGLVDLVVTDVMMPELDGPTLARRIVTDWPGIPLIFMTGYPADTLADHRLLPEETPRIEKPFAVAAFLRQVRATLRPHPSNPNDSDHPSRS